METATQAPAVVGIVMGSDSDWPIMQAAAAICESLGVAFEARVVSAHRTPDLLFDYAETTAARGLARSSPVPAAPRTCRECLLPDTGAGARRAGCRRNIYQGMDSLLDRADAARRSGGNLCRRRGRAANATLFAVAMLAAGDGEMAQALAGKPR